MSDSAFAAGSIVVEVEVDVGDEVDVDVEDEDAGVPVTVVVDDVDAIAPSLGEFDEPEAHAASGTTATKIKAMRFRRTAPLRFRR
jgi:hypothetical protein